MRLDSHTILSFWGPQWGSPPQLPGPPPQCAVGSLYSQIKAEVGTPLWAEGAAQPRKARDEANRALLHSSVPVRTKEFKESETAHQPTARLSPPCTYTPCPSHSRGFPCQLLLLDPCHLSFVPAALAEVVPEAFLCLDSCKRCGEGCGG